MRFSSLVTTIPTATQSPTRAQTSDVVHTAPAAVELEHPTRVGMIAMGAFRIDEHWCSEIVTVRSMIARGGYRRHTSGRWDRSSVDAGTGLEHLRAERNRTIRRVGQEQPRGE
jgi:hypothetical protein